MYEISKKRLGAGMLAAGINTARELAKVSGVSVNTISRLNNGGEAGNPTAAGGGVEGRPGGTTGEPTPSGQAQVWPCWIGR